MFIDISIFLSLCTISYLQIFKMLLAKYLIEDQRINL